MLNIYETRATKDINPNWVNPDREDYQRRERIILSFVGLAALMLPFLVILADVAFVPSCLRHSLSHYYYGRPSGDVFVVSLGFVGSLLIVYRGENPKVARYATIAGIAAICVALCPTIGTGCTAGDFDGRVFINVPFMASEMMDENFQLFGSVATIHYGAAVVLFGIMIYFSRAMFSGTTDDDYETSPDGTRVLKAAKRRRNEVYFVATVVIVIAVIAMLTYAVLSWWRGWDADNPLSAIYWTLLWETCGLWAFAAVCLTKGRFFDTSLKS